MLLRDVQKFSFGSCYLRSISFFDQIFQIFTGVVFLHLLAFLRLLWSVFLLIEVQLFFIESYLLVVLRIRVSLKCHVLCIIWIFLLLIFFTFLLYLLRLGLLLEPFVLVVHLHDELKRLLAVASLQGVFDIEELIKALFYEIILWQLSIISVPLQLYLSNVMVVSTCILLNLLLIISKLLSYDLLLLAYFSICFLPGPLPAKFDNLLMKFLFFGIFIDCCRFL